MWDDNRRAIEQHYKKLLIENETLKARVSYWKKDALKLAEKLNMTSLQDWQDLHNDNGDENYTGKDIVEVSIEWGSRIIYDCVVEIDTFNNLPVGNAETIKMTRSILDADDPEDAEAAAIELDYEEFPHFIARAAEKKARGER